MTIVRMTFKALVEKGSDTDLLREMMSYVASRMMAVEVEGLTGATRSCAAWRRHDAVIVAVGANTDGRREVLGMAVGPSKAEPFWTRFLRSLTTRGLRGVKHLISDAHVGLKAAAAKVIGSSWQRCRVHLHSATLSSTSASNNVRWWPPPSAPISFKRPKTMRTRNGASCQRHASRMSPIDFATAFRDSLC